MYMYIYENIVLIKQFAMLPLPVNSGKLQLHKGPQAEMCTVIIAELQVNQTKWLVFKIIHVKDVRSYHRANIWSTW